MVYVKQRVNTLRGDIIAFHVVEVTNVIQVDFKMILNFPKAGNWYNLSSSSPCPHFPTKYFPLTSPQSLQMPANLELSSYFNLTNEPQASGCSSVWPLKYWTTASPELLEAVTVWNVRPCFFLQWKSVSAEWRTSVPELFHGTFLQNHVWHVWLLCSNRQAGDNQTLSRIFYGFD